MKTSQQLEIGKIYKIKTKPEYLNPALFYFKAVCINTDSCKIKVKMLRVGDERAWDLDISKEAFNVIYLNIESVEEINDKRELIKLKLRGIT